MPRLSGGLFDADPDHEAYSSALADILYNVDRQAIPDLARQMSLNHLQHMLSLQRIDSFESWLPGLAEFFSDGFILASAEEWGLNSREARERIDDSMVAVNRGRLAVGSEAITAADANTWLSLILLGLNSDLAEWEPLNEYVRSQGAWQRLNEWVLPQHLMVGEHVMEPKAEEIDSWRIANQLAWRDGIFLALLDQLGLLRTETGARTFGGEDRPLSGLLLEVDPEQYQLTAAQLLQATAHAVPDVAKEIYAGLIGPFVDRKLADQYGQWLRDTFESGYVLCVSETWEDLDPDILRDLIDEGIRRVIAEADTRDPNLLLHDPEYRIRNVSLGIAGDMEYFATLNNYLGEQQAFLRIGGFGDMLLNQVASSGAIKRRHVSKLEGPLYISFIFGVSIGLLDQLGEIPPVRPERLP